MRKIKEICAEIQAGGTGDEAVLDKVRQEMREDILSSLPDGAGAVHIRAGVQLHEERAKALDHRLASGGTFLAHARQHLMARTLEIAGSETAAAAALAAPQGKARRADALGRTAKPEPSGAAGKRGKGGDKDGVSRRNGKGRHDKGGAGKGADGKARHAKPAARQVPVSVRGERRAGETTVVA